MTKVAADDFKVRPGTGQTTRLVRLPMYVPSLGVTVTDRSHRMP